MCPLCPSDISPASGGNPSTRAPITLTLALSRRGRGDTRVLPEGVFGVGGVVPHLACFVLPWVGVQSAEAPASVGMTVRFGWRRFFGVVVVRLYEPPASLRAASPFCFASLRKKGEDLAPRTPGIPGSLCSAKGGGFGGRRDHRDGRVRLPAVSRDRERLDQLDTVGQRQRPFREVCTTSVIPAKAGIQRGRATGKRRRLAL